MTLSPTKIDLNADLGEGFGRWSLGDDEALLEVISSANVACGFHGGDPQIMDRVVKAAAERGVSIGAQVSYRDLVGFGRREISASPEEVRTDVLYQIGALQGFCSAAGTEVRYLKPHGALYNRCVHDQELAEAVVAATLGYNPELAILGMPGSELLVVAEKAGLDGVAEAFGDRAYTDNGRLVPRGQTGAVISDQKVVAERCMKIVGAGRVTTSSGLSIPIDARSLCFHGDTPGAAALVIKIRRELAAAGFSIEPFA